jgi:ketosteroid isomerase-like protein
MQVGEKGSMHLELALTKSLEGALEWIGSRLRPAGTRAGSPPNLEVNPAAISSRTINPMLQSPETIARAFVQAINAHDINELAKLMSDNHRFVDSLGNVVQGREQMRDGWAGYFHMVPDYALVVNETSSNGPTVVMLGLAHGTYAKDGRLPPENYWQTPAAWRAHVENDTVAEWRVYADNEPIRRLMRSTSSSDYQ